MLTEIQDYTQIFHIDSNEIRIDITNGHAERVYLNGKITTEEEVFEHPTCSTSRSMIIRQIRGENDANCEFCSLRRYDWTNNTYVQSVDYLPLIYKEIIWVHENKLKIEYPNYWTDVLR